MEHFGFDESTKSLSKNGYKDEAAGEGELEEEKLQKDEEKAFRSVAARANYMALDIPNIQYPVKEVCRSMAAPTTTSYSKLKKLARYIAGFLEVSFEYPWQDEE